MEEFFVFLDEVLLIGEVLLVVGRCEVLVGEVFVDEVLEVEELLVFLDEVLLVEELLVVGR